MARSAVGVRSGPESDWTRSIFHAGGTFSCPNLQRGYLKRMDWLITEELGALPSFFRASLNDVDVSMSDIRPFVRVS